MNIVFFSRLFYPHIGGVEKHVEEISKQLVKKGHMITVITEEFDKSLPAFDNHQNISIYRIPLTTHGWFKKFIIWQWLWRRRQILKSADLVHCHDVFFWYLPFRFLYLKKKVYTTFHGYESFPITKKSIVIRKISEKLSRGNICIGEFIQKWYETKPSFVTYGGVAVKKKVGNYFHKDSAVFIGRLDEQTGILMYARAMQLIRKKIRNFQFIVYGSGKLQKKIAKIANSVTLSNSASEKISNFHFGFVSGYLAILEVMAAKRLVFAMYDNPLKKDYLQLSPFLSHIVVVSSPHELVSKLFYFLSHQKEEKIIVDRAYAYAKMQSWDNVVCLYEKLWNL